MKKKVSILFFVIIFLTSTATKNKNTYLDKLSNLTLQNIEALASNEEKPIVFCYDPGDIDCLGVKVRLVLQDQSNRFFDFEDFY